MTNEIQQTRYDRLVRRVAGIIGPGSKVSEVITELFPMIDMETDKPELQVLGGTVPAFGNANINAGPGLNPRVQIFNPVGSGNIVTVTSVFVTSSQATVMRWTISSIALTTAPNVKLTRDPRSNIATPPVAEMRTDETVALTGATGQNSILANSPLYLTDPNGIAILPPGFGFELGGNDLDGAISATFYWRERPAQESELSF